MRKIRTTKRALPLAGLCVAALTVAWPASAQRVQVTLDTSRIGIVTRDVTEADVKQFKLPGQFGACVTAVESGSAAEKAGLRSGDVIGEFDGERVRSSAELQRLVRETPVGRTVKVGAIRDGKRIDLTVTTESEPNAGAYTFRSPDGRQFRFDLPSPGFRENPNQPFFWSPQIPDWRRPFRGPRMVFPGPIPLNTPRLGIGVQELTPQLAEYFHTQEGVLVATVEDRSAASRAGVKAGDILVSVDGHRVANADDVRTALREKRAGGEVTLGIVRDGKPLTLKATVAGETHGTAGRF